MFALGFSLWLVASLVFTAYGGTPALKALPKPLEVVPSRYWDGDDGPWSTFLVSVGKTAPPAKTEPIRLLPSISLALSLFVDPQGCKNTSSATFPWTESTCDDKRGGILDCGGSSTCQVWTDRTPTLQLGAMQVVKGTGFNFGVTGAWEAISLGDYPSGGTSNATTIDKAPIGMFASLGYTFTGLLGIRPVPINISDFGRFQNPIPSYIELLKNQSLIPSLSYAYTAGANYRQEYGSLVLGGYDAGRIDPTSLKPEVPWWAYHPDDEIGASVWLDEVTFTASGTAGQGFQSVGLLKDRIPELQASGVPSIIDTNRPYFYLPQALCDNIASRFGLVFNNEFNHYLINETQHQTLLKQNLTLDLTVRAWTSPADSTTPANRTISIPYAALALDLSWPLYRPSADGPSSSKYFPMLPTVNGTDGRNILGRALLQQSVLISDQEHTRFALLPINTQRKENSSNIISIAPAVLPKMTTAASNGSKDGSSDKVSGGLIAGIVVAILAVIGFLGFLVFLTRRRRARRRADGEAAAARSAAKAEAAFAAASRDNTTAGLPSPTLNSPNQSHELDGNLAAKYETDGTETPHEIGRSWPLTPVVEAPVSRSSFGPGEVKYQLDGENRPVIRVYYEMDASPGDPGTNETLTSGISPASPEVGTHRTDGTGISSLDHSPQGSTKGNSIPPVPSLQRAAENDADERLNPLPPASPIPATPLEFYGRLPQEPPSNANLTPENERRIRDWVGRAPGLPAVTLTPATPATPRAQAATREAQRTSWVGGTREEWADRGLF